MTDWNTIASVVTTVGVGVAIVWRIAVLQTHVDELRDKADLYATKEQLKREIHFLKLEVQRANR